MSDKPFHCKIVGMQITADVCETRIRQAKEFRAKGEPHASLNKCIICKGLAPTVQATEPAEVADVAPEEILCSHCKRPKIHKKLRWAIKHGMHVNCYYTLSKKGTAPVPVVEVTHPAPGVKVTNYPAGTITETEQPEDPERIIQCSAIPSQIRCHDCYAIKNCALYDAWLDTVGRDDEPIVEEQPPGRVEPLVPDTTEQGHYTACAIQPIEFIVANKMDFLEGNVIKYVARYKNKNGLEDLAKARDYLNRLIEREEAAAI